MRWEPHVRFGERAGKTDQRRRWHRVPARLHLGHPQPRGAGAVLGQLVDARLQGQPRRVPPQMNVVIDLKVFLRGNLHAHATDPRSRRQRDSGPVAMRALQETAHENTQVSLDALGWDTALRSVAAMAADTTRAGTVVFRRIKGQQ
jgi:hypothetical protein